MNINEIISQLDELRGKIGNKDIEINKDHIPQECALFIKALVENYDTLRNAALEAERYKRAGEELAEAIKAIPSSKLSTGGDSLRDKALSAYRQAVEQKEV